LKESRFICLLIDQIFQSACLFVFENTHWTRIGFCFLAFFSSEASGRCRLHGAVSTVLILRKSLTTPFWKD